MVYTAAAIAHFDPSWISSWNERVLLMVRDVMNPSNQDANFPVFRYKDWYAGTLRFIIILTHLLYCKHPFSNTACLIESEI